MYEAIYECIYMNQYLHMAAHHSQCIGHDVNSTRCSPTLLIQSWVATSVGVHASKQQFSRYVISVCNSLNLCLDCMGVFRGCSTGSCNLCLGQWQSLHDCAVSQ